MFFMDVATVTRRAISGRRVRPGSMIATRMQMFELGGQEGGGGSIHKASSMGNLVGVASGQGQVQTTPTQVGRQVYHAEEKAPAAAVVCNPSTGQPAPLARHQSSLLHCLRATRDPAPKPHSHTPFHVGSTSSNDSDHNSQLTSPHPEGDSAELPDQLPPLPPSSPPAGAWKKRSSVVNLKQLFEAGPSQHAALSRAISLPSLLAPPQPQAHRHMVAVLPPSEPAQPAERTRSTGWTNTSSGSLSYYINKTCGTGLAGKAKVPLLPPIQQVRKVEPQPMFTGQLPRQPRNTGRYSGPALAEPEREAQRKVPLLPPSSYRPPITQQTSHATPSDIPPPKPPRAAHRTRLAQEEEVGQVCGRALCTTYIMNTV